MALKRRIFYLAGILVSFNALTQSPEPIHIMTEYWKPYSYVDSDGNLKGVATIKVKNIFNRSGLRYQISTQPWARSLKIATDRQNTFIYPIVKNTKREAEFIWIGEILPRQSKVFVKLAESRHINFEDEVGLRQWTIGVNLQGDAHEYLQENQFDKIFPHGDKVDTIKLLLLKRVDLLLIDKASFAAALNNSAYDARKFVTKRAFETRLFLAAHPKTEPVIIKKVQEAFNSFKKDKD